MQREECPYADWHIKKPMSWFEGETSIPEPRSARPEDDKLRYSLLGKKRHPSERRKRGAGMTSEKLGKGFGRRRALDKTRQKKRGGRRKKDERPPRISPP